MRKNVKAWLDALRSGEYIQGTGCLRHEDSFCCLGVACEVSNLGLWVYSDEYEQGNKSYLCADNDSSYESDLSLPKPVRDWLGIKNPEGSMSGAAYFKVNDKTYGSLSLLNDARIPFSQIADLIEEHYELLFWKNDE